MRLAALEFRHYGFALRACDGGDAKRKGKIERPFRDLKAGFLAEMSHRRRADRPRRATHAPLNTASMTSSAKTGHDRTYIRSEPAIAILARDGEGRR